MFKTLAMVAVIGLSVPAMAAKPEGPGCGECVPSKPALYAPLQYSGYFEMPQPENAANPYIAGTISNSNPGPYTGNHGYVYFDNDPSKQYSLFNAVEIGNSNTGLRIRADPPWYPDLVSNPVKYPGAFMRLDVHKGAVFNNAGVYMNITYALKLSTKTLASADQLAAMLALNPQLGIGKGKYASQVNSGLGQALVLAQSTNRVGGGTSFSRTCSTLPTNFDKSGCGSGQYALNLLFSRGDEFEGGSALDFYARISLTTSAFTSFDDTPTGATAYIDPEIQFSKALEGIDGLEFSTGGTAIPLAFVPEPASWALMIGGFGLVGGAMRRRKVALG